MVLRLEHLIELIIRLYTEKVPYSLRQDNQTKKEIKNKNLMEYRSSVNPHSLDKTKEKCEVLKNEFANQHNERWTYCRFRKMILKSKKLVNRFKNKRKKLQ
jgi:hypothetical protein